MEEESDNITLGSVERSKLYVVVKKRVSLFFIVRKTIVLFVYVTSLRQGIEW